MTTLTSDLSPTLFIHYTKYHRFYKQFNSNKIMKTLANNNSNNESVNTTRRAASKNNADVDALRKLPTLEPASEITEAEGVKVGDKVRHNKHEEVATVTAIREAFVNRADGYRYLYTLDFGQSVLGPFQVELNGGEFLREAFTLESASEITEKPQPSSWVTDYTYDDFAKLEANPEAIEADPDIMGKRFRLTAKDGSAPLSELQVFIQDYAGNERHALYYIWDEWMQEVRANVRPLDWLREHFCHANGWQPVAA